MNYIQGIVIIRRKTLIVNSEIVYAKIYIQFNISIHCIVECKMYEIFIFLVDNFSSPLGVFNMEFIMYTENYNKNRSLCKK